jgi:hypothetical protein
MPKERAAGNPPARSPKISILVLVIHIALSPNMSSWRCWLFAVCGLPGLREDTQLSQSSPLVIQSLSGVPEALSR